MRQPRRSSIRQLRLPMEYEPTTRLGKELREEAINVLADLLLEALDGVLAERGYMIDESED